MNTVVTINLNGRAYQLEEVGFAALRAYLDEAAKKLEGDPGKAEILSDLEQAIAEKCDKVLNPNKTVVLSGEIESIIKEMGPVESGSEHTENHVPPKGHTETGAHKHLYLIRDGAMLAGVCTGLAAYFDVDVSLVRVIFAALTILTSGLGIAIYIALAFILPYAETGEEMAAAYGQTFNAQNIVDRAKVRFTESYERVTGTKYGSWDSKEYAEAYAQKYQGKNDWKKWKHEMKQQRKQWRQSRRVSRYGNPITGLVSALLAILWIVALISLLSTGAIFGWAIPAGIPIWVAIILLFICYHAITGPIRGAGHSYQWGPNGEYYGGNDMWEGFIGGLTFLFLVIALGWAYLHVPQVHDFILHPIAGVRSIIEWFKLHSWTKHQ